MTHNFFFNKKKIKTVNTERENSEIDYESFMKYQSFSNPNLFHLPFILNTDTSTESALKNQETSFINFEELDAKNVEIIQTKLKINVKKNNFSRVSIKEPNLEPHILENNSESNIKANNDSKMIFFELSHNNNQYNRIKNFCKIQQKDLIDDTSKKIINFRKYLKSMPKPRSFPSRKLILPNIYNNPSSENTKEENKKNILDRVNFNFQGNDDKMHLTIWRELKQNIWKPEPRESSSIILYGKRLYVYGGMGNQIFNELLMFDLGFYF